MDVRPTTSSRPSGPSEGPDNADADTSLRPATIGDLDAIMTIEKLSFPTPWSRKALADEIENKSWSRVVAATRQDRLVGFMVFWTVVDELHLLVLAVHPAWRRRGLARAMIEHLLEIADTENLTDILLELRASNRIALKLYSGFGFESIAVRRGYYADTGEDAVVMRLRRSR